MAEPGKQNKTVITTNHAIAGKTNQFFFKEKIICNNNDKGPPSRPFRLPTIEPKIIGGRLLPIIGEKCY
jgi:hypothetical protein